jgi:hypothetical protein
MRQVRYTPVAFEEGAQAQAIQTVNSTVTDRCRLTNRWSGRVRDKVPSSYGGVRAAQLNR